MPTYDYRCLECNIRFEKFQSMKDDPINTCPDCEGNVKRLIGSGAGIIFKGGGFYETDYRSDSYKKDAQKDKPSETPTTTKAKPEKTKTT